MTHPSHRFVFSYRDTIHACMAHMPISRLPDLPSEWEAQIAMLITDSLLYLSISYP